ncbi:MAG: diacylglycerol kinase family lipid kinase [Saprospiraceae bacterium]|nr:diacylglycerol kinase family lipid kinase [Saprospiraceae bacterium]
MVHADDPRGLPWLLLINPGAGRGKALEKWGILEPLLRKAGPAFEIRFSDAPGRIADMAEQACREGFSSIVILGGDGSVHEAVNGLLRSGLPIDRLPVLRLLPCGTGNDWARWWRIPSDPQRWIRQSSHWPVQAHAAGRIDYQRDGQSRHRYFANVAGLAYDAWIVRKVEEKPATKRHPFIYILRVLQWLFHYSPQQADVTADHRSWTGSFYTINAGICPYSGGGMRLTPHARPDQGFLAITIAGDLPLYRILLHMWRFYTGSIGRVKGVETLLARDLDIRPAGHPVMGVEADGEWLGETPCRITVLPDAFRIAAPPIRH